MTLIFKSAFTLFGGIQPEKLPSQSTLNVSNDAPAVLSKPPTLSSESLETLVQKDINLICSNPTQQKTQSVQRSSKTVRRNNKYLTTCTRCGHIRFGQKNKNQKVVNGTYPYEHSATGGCPVERVHYMKKKPGKLCSCIFCAAVSDKFNLKPRKKRGTA